MPNIKQTSTISYQEGEEVEAQRRDDLDMLFMVSETLSELDISDMLVEWKHERPQ